MVIQNEFPVKVCLPNEKQNVLRCSKTTTTSEFLEIVTNRLKVFLFDALFIGSYSNLSNFKITLAIYEQRYSIERIEIGVQN